MIRSLSYCVVLLAVLTGSSLSSMAQQSRPADVIITNARIYTLNPQQKWAEAIAIQAEHIIAVGDRKSVDSFRGPSTRVIDAHQHLLLPGFTDSHMHFLEASLGLQQLHLDGVKTLPDTLARIKDYAKAHPNEPWILGRGWDYAIFAPSGMPDKKYLDEIVPDRPVYLTGYDGHSAWANSKALKMAGITRDTADPPGGSFVRDPHTGEPTGMVKEDGADELIVRVIPAPSRESSLQAVRAGMREANRVGLVRVHGASELLTRIDDLQNADLYEDLRRNGELTVRMYISYRAKSPILTQTQINEIEAARSRYHDEWISAGAVKFFLDGVIESHTAAMLEPYSDDPKQIGSTLWDPANYTAAVTELDQRGFQIFTHAIGDKAVRLALDAYQHATEVNHTKDARHRVEHIETVSAADIPRFGQLGVIASMQPLHSYPDADTLKIWARNVGPDRVTRAWAWKSIEQSGGALAFGSDWPVVTLNPWPGVQTAITRKTAEGQPPDGFVPSQRLSLEDTIRAYTLGAAFAGHREKTEGSLETGKLADLIIVDRDLFRVDPTKIGETQVLLTMVGGKVVYQSPAWKTLASGK